jgi:hypothetical protein
MPFDELRPLIQEQHPAEHCVANLPVDWFTEITGFRAPFFA